MNLPLLKNPLCNRPTVLRCVRFLELDFIFNSDQWYLLNMEINLEYNKANKVIVFESDLKTVSQSRLWGKSKSKKKVCCYPAEFIPTMLIIIKKHYDLLTAPKPKVKRVRIIKKVVVSEKVTH
jgi:hypothetical protein